MIFFLHVSVIEENGLLDLKRKNEKCGGNIMVFRYTVYVIFYSYYALPEFKCRNIFLCLIALYTL